MFKHGSCVERPWIQGRRCKIWRRHECGHVSGFFRGIIAASPDGFREWHPNNSAASMCL
jgi:hypothetical protein